MLPQPELEVFVTTITNQLVRAGFGRHWPRVQYSSGFVVHGKTDDSGLYCLVQYRDDWLSPAQSKIDSADMVQVYADALQDMFTVTPVQDPVLGLVLRVQAKNS
jgi:hypothetical protein